MLDLLLTLIDLSWPVLMGLLVVSGLALVLPHNAAPKNAAKISLHFTKNQRMLKTM